MTGTRESVERKASKWLIAFALIFAALVVAFTAYQRVRQTNILATQDWCARAIKAEELSSRPTTSCGELMKIQIKAIATNSHIDAVSQAIAMLSIIILVVAGGNLSLTAGKGGVDLGLSRNAKHARAQGAKETAEAADSKAEEIVKSTFTEGPEQ